MPAPTPEQEAASAQLALAAGRIADAADHLAHALTADPLRKDWLALLARTVDAAEEPLTLAPLDAESTLVGTVALRAYVMFKLGRYHEAVDLILKCALAAPNKPFLDWALAWLAKPRVAHKVNCLKITGHIESLIDELPRLRVTRGADEALLKRLPTFVRLLRESQIYDGGFLFLCTTLLRRLPDLNAALDTARELHELEPGHQSCVALAMVYRDRDDIERAERWFREALRYQPDDVPVRLDLGDMFFDHRRLDDSERWYREALKIEPEHAWAKPSLYAVRHARTDDPAWKDKLEAYAREHPGNDRARNLMDRFGPWFGAWLPDPQEASLGLIRLLVDKWRAGQSIEIKGMTLSSLEAPSIYLAFDLQMARENKRGQLNIEVESIPQPDVRYPRTEVKYLLWRYKDARPTAAVSAPPPRVSDAVAVIASRPYHLKTWLSDAAGVASQFGPGKVRDILAVMVHPPPLPRKFTPWEWVQRVQIAAAVMIAKIESGWEGSKRRQALFDICNGPLDWTTVAGILALAALVEDEPNLADDVASLFNELLSHAPQGGYICHLHPLVVAYQRMPNLSPQERENLAAWRNELERAQ
jgi:tetratricopeptide (TPR) repeat protein